MENDEKWLKPPKKSLWAETLIFPQAVFISVVIRALTSCLLLQCYFSGLVDMIQDYSFEINSFSPVDLITCA